jgi:cobyrinic acid a,c-diamide synthase
VSVPRLMLAGVEPGPAVSLTAGALVAGLDERRTVRPIMLGLDVPLFRVLYATAVKAPRVVDPALHGQTAAAELCEYWAENVAMTVFVAALPALDRWEGIEASRPVDFAERIDAPVVLVLDARERGATAAAAVHGVRALARRADIAGLVIVGADDSTVGRELLETLRRDVALPVLGRIPPQLSEQFARQQAAVASGAMRTVGPKPAPGSDARLCKEAAAYLQLDEFDAIAARRGYLPAVERRLLAPDGTAAGLTLAVAWGAPLQPLALENLDVLQAMGVELAPLNIARDRELPDGVNGLFIAGQVDEQQLGAFAGNGELLTALAAAIDEGLPTLALGGGALLLMRRLADSRGRSHELAGVVPAEAEMIETYDRPRYVKVSATRANPYDEGENLLYELFDLEFLMLEQDAFAYQVEMGGDTAQAEGFAVSRCLASTLYPSFAHSPAMVGRFVAAMRLGVQWH